MSLPKQWMTLLLWVLIEHFTILWKKSLGTTRRCNVVISCGAQKHCYWIHDCQISYLRWFYLHQCINNRSGLLALHLTLTRRTRGSLFVWPLPFDLSGRHGCPYQEFRTPTGVVKETLQPRAPLQGGDPEGCHIVSWYQRPHGFSELPTSSDSNRTSPYYGETWTLNPPLRGGLIISNTTVIRVLAANNPNLSSIAVNTACPAHTVTAGVSLALCTSNMVVHTRCTKIPCFAIRTFINYLDYFSVQITCTVLPNWPIRFQQVYLLTAVSIIKSLVKLAGGSDMCSIGEIWKMCSRTKWQAMLGESRIVFP